MDAIIAKLQAITGLTINSVPELIKQFERQYPDAANVSLALGEWAFNELPTLSDQEMLEILNNFQQA